MRHQTGMSHKDAPPLPHEQQRFEAVMLAIAARNSETIALGRDKDGQYFARSSRDAWELWQIASDGCDVSQSWFGDRFNAGAAARINELEAKVELLEMQLSDAQSQLMEWPA
jgi:hypothetical protein